jgi:hypothetical protein
MTAFLLNTLARYLDTVDTMESQKAETVTQNATNTKALHGVSSMVTAIKLDPYSAPSTQLTDYEQNSESTLDVNISSPGQYSMQLDEVQPTPPQAPPRLDFEVSAAVQVLRIMESYGQYKDVSYQWRGIASYAPIVATQIRAGKPVRILFTGFGFKSPLVLSRLPDLGEKLALAHLDGLCSNIATVYEVGAEVHVCSDGLLYNGLQNSHLSLSAVTDSSQIYSVFQIRPFGATWKVFVRL